jgi:hypothetical protein
MGKTILSQSKRLHEVLEQDFAGMDGGTIGRNTNHIVLLTIAHNLNFIRTFHNQDKSTTVFNLAPIVFFDNHTGE